MSATRSIVELFEIAQSSGWNEPNNVRLALLEIAAHRDATKYQFQDAVNIALGFDSPELALEIHDVYESKFGEKLSGDVGRDDIETMLQQKNEMEGTSKVFKRQTILARGHFSNFFTFHPVKEIVIAPGSITFIVDHYFHHTKRYVYNYTEVRGIAVRERNSWRGVGNTSVKIRERTCRVITSNHSFFFDVSASYGDFRNPRELVAELAKIHVIEYVGVKWSS